MKKLTSLSVILACSLLLAACGGQSASNENEGNQVDTNVQDDSNNGDVNYDNNDDYTNLSTSSTPRPKPKFPKPDLNRIVSDLVGRTITEGTSNGYYPQNWNFTIESGQIKDIELLETVVDNQEMYIVEIKVQIQPAGNFYYDTTLKVSYINTPDEGWVMDNVVSRGMDIVSNHYYDDCIDVYSYADFGGTNYYYCFINNSDSMLMVGGSVYYNGKWEKFIKSVRGNSSRDAYVYGKDYKIDFVIKEY